MPRLTIIHGNSSTDALFEGVPVLSSVLRENGFAVDMPCGGKGVCGKCRVQASGALSPLGDKEREAGSRLACQTVLLGDATVTLPRAQALQSIAVSGERPVFALKPMGNGCGLAVDIGTTTLAVSLLDLYSGNTLATAAGENPQRSVSADVVGRMEAAMNGQGGMLQAQVLQAIGALRREVCARARLSPDRIAATVVTGNTTMLYLLTGRSPEPLSHAPFHAEHLFGGTEHIGTYDMYLPRCLSAFVGADIACAILASRMCERDETALLADVGTNGEMALWHGGRLYVCATAAGPAFEAGGISCGVGSVEGAIDRVWQQNGGLGYSTIAGAPPVGVCGSGIIDAVATLRALEMLDETGLLEDGSVALGGGVVVTQKDVRNIQLAKSAIAAGMLTLLKAVGVEPSQVGTLYLAGGFGRHIDLRSAAAIGLIPQALAGKTKVIGNAALAGAEMLLLQTDFNRDIDRYAVCATVVTLSGNPVFTEHYMDCMMLEPV